MKVLLINGSPHAKGSTYTALHEMEKVFTENGIEAEIVHIGNKDIRGCHDHKCCFLHSVFPFSFPLFSLVYSISNRSCRPIVIRSVYYYASSCMLLSFAA